MDAFYASVEQRDHPEYRGKPVIVGANPEGGHGRGVVSAASYEARRFGIHSAQPISQAYRKCPQGVFLPVRGRRYVEISKRIMTIFRSFTPLVEAVSLDEAFLDVTGTERLLGSASDIGRLIKQRIIDDEQLTASVGIGPSKLIAKIASDLKKPDGFVVVPIDSVEAFLDPLTVNQLWGVGQKMEERLHHLGVKTVGQLRSISQDVLEGVAGQMGLTLWRYARGLDFSPVIPDREAKSVSNETTFSQDQDDPQIIDETLRILSTKVGYRLRNQQLTGRTIVLKVRLADFSLHVRHLTLARSTNSDMIINDMVKMLYDNLPQTGQSVRLLGVGVRKLQSTFRTQLDLFPQDNPQDMKVTKAVDKLRNKFGEHIITRGINNKRKSG